MIFARKKSLRPALTLQNDGLAAVAPSSTESRLDTTPICEPPTPSALSYFGAFAVSRNRLRCPAPGCVGADEARAAELVRDNAGTAQKEAQ